MYNIYDIEEIIDKVKERKTFDGIPFKVNYAEKSIPYCYLNKQGEVEGIFKDAMKIIAESIKNQVQKIETSGL